MQGGTVCKFILLLLKGCVSKGTGSKKKTYVQGCVLNALEYLTQGTLEQPFYSQGKSSIALIS